MGNEGEGTPRVGSHPHMFEILKNTLVLDGVGSAHGKRQTVPGGEVELRKNSDIFKLWSAIAAVAELLLLLIL